MSLRAGDYPFPIVPWSEAPLMEFMELWHCDQGTGVPWREVVGGWTVCEDEAHDLVQHIVTWLD
jgi:hypothetical protein